MNNETDLAGITEDDLLRSIRVRRLHFEELGRDGTAALELVAECEWLREWLTHTMVSLIGDAPNFSIWSVQFSPLAEEAVRGKKFDVWIQRAEGETVAAQLQRLKAENAELKRQSEPRHE